MSSPKTQKSICIDVEKGKIICDDLLEGKIGDFETYVFEGIHETQNPVTAYNRVGIAIYEYVNSLEEESEKSKIIDRVFETQNFKKITILRVARDLSTKFRDYEGNRVRRRNYLSQHTDVKKSEFDMALMLAGFSSLSRKYVDFRYNSANYAKYQNA